MLPSAEESKFQKNEESLLHVAEHLLPAHTGRYATDLRKDPLMEPLTEHWIYDPHVGLKAKTEEKLYRKKVAVDTAKVAKDKVEKDMNLFAADELGPTMKALEEAEENERRCEAAMTMKEQVYDKELEELTKSFEERKEKGMKEVRKNLTDAKYNVDEKTTEANEKADMGKFFHMYSHCNHLYCIF